jgi:hypothetical protein
MKPWMALSLVVLLAGCANDRALRIRCEGPWKEMPRVSASTAWDSKTTGQTRGSRESQHALDTALVGDADQKPAAGRQSSKVDRAGSREVIEKKIQEAVDDTR